MTFVANTNPYPWPYDGDLDAGHLAFVICGAQTALARRIDKSDAMVDRFRHVAAAVRSWGGAVVWVRHGRRAARSTAPMLPDRTHKDWNLEVKPDHDDLVVDAVGWDGCFGSDLEQLLRAAGRTKVALGGLASELTVDSTVRRLNDAGFECLVLTDCCAPIDAGLGERAHASLTMSGGIFGALGKSNPLITALIANRDANLHQETAP